MSRKATANEISEILKKHSLEFMKTIGVSSEVIFLAMPTDGEGVRIQIKVENGSLISIPNPVLFKLNNKELKVPVEVTRSYRKIEPQEEDE